MHLTKSADDAKLGGMAIAADSALTGWNACQWEISWNSTKANSKKYPRHQKMLGTDQLQCSFPENGSEELMEVRLAICQQCTRPIILLYRVTQSRNLLGLCLISYKRGSPLCQTFSWNISYAHGWQLGPTPSIFFRDRECYWQTFSCLQNEICLSFFSTVMCLQLVVSL